MAEKKPRKKKDKEPTPVVEQVEDTGPKPLPYPDFHLTETLRHNPNLLVYQGRILDDTTSSYIRRSMHKFYLSKGIDKDERSFMQKDLEQALLDGFKI